MKKILSSLFVLMLLLILFWIASGWFFGANAETELRRYLRKSNSIPGEKLFRAELLQFKKTAFGAKARLTIHSDMVFLDEALGDLDINTQLVNGPLFINTNIDTITSNDSHLNVGRMRWHLSINQEALEQSQADILATLFPDKLPTAIVVIDFKNKAHYQITLNSYLGKALIQGVYDLNTAENRGVVALENTTLNLFSFQFKIPHARIDYQHQQNITAEFKPGTTHIEIPELFLAHPKLAHTLELNVDANMALQTVTKNKQDFLYLLLKTHITQKQPGNNPVEVPVNEADLRLQIENLSIDGVIAVSETHAELDNLRQQIQWTLEENGELPEGQDRIWHLNDQIQQRQAQLPVLMSQTLFANQLGADGKSGITLNITANKSQHKSILSAHLSTQKAPNFSLKNSPVNTIQQLLQGSAKVDLSHELFKFIRLLMKNPEKERLPNSSFKLVLKNGEISIKGVPN